MVNLASLGPVFMRGSVGVVVRLARQLREVKVLRLLSDTTDKLRIKLRKSQTTSAIRNPQTLAKALNN
eukprot:604693-Amphidinium_carterae.1